MNEWLQEQSKKKYFNFQVHVSYFFLLAVGGGKNLENWKISSIVNFLCVTEEKKRKKENLERISFPNFENEELEEM